MKSFVAPAILAIASTSMAAVVPLSNGAYWTNETNIEKRNDQICVQIQSTVTDWYYTFSGIWGSDSGQGPSAIGSFCVNTDDNAGGAMFFGPDPNPGPGSTKLECFFPTNDEANCDVSLVDGYSLSMQCHAETNPTTIGGPIALYSQGNTCPDQEGPNCINSIGGTATSQDQINAFFQPATQNGNNYCIWWDCAQVDYTFSASQGITCTIDPNGQ